MERKEFWKLIGKLFDDKELTRMGSNREGWETAQATVKIKNVL